MEYSTSSANFKLYLGISPKYSVNIPNPMGTSGADIVAYISGPDSDVLKKEALNAIRLLKEAGIAGDIDSSIRATKPRTNIIPNRAVRRHLGNSEPTLGRSVRC